MSADNPDRPPGAASCWRQPVANAIIQPTRNGPCKGELIRTFKVNPDGRTAILAADAEIMGPMTEVDIGPGKRAWLEGWTGRNDILGWQISVRAAADYDLAVIAEGSSSRPVIEIGAGTGTIQKHVPPRWDRVEIGTVRLPAGKSTITLRSAGNGKMKRLLSLELIRPAIRKNIERRAEKFRAATDWFIKGRYGLMFHWTSRSRPRRGQPKAYREAVDDFNVPRFADTVDAAGAGHVILTTSHADFRWPGPNPAVDKLLKGRTCKRDLIGEIADALADRGVRLMLYHHPGHDDANWWARTGFDKPAHSTFIRNWTALIKDAGQRYGKRLAGWWFDDAMFTYYPLNPPWQQMAAAARAGNADRLICWNSWVLPKVTDWGDLSSWEVFLTPEVISGHGHLPLAGDGRYTAGPQGGLQAHITTPATKGGWVYDREDSAIGGMLYQTPTLIRMLQEAARRRCVVTLNLEVYQDGGISRGAARQFAEVKQALKTRRRRTSR